jgi:ubiquinone/menaquinone biosynthesis C-methylase UbiE
MSVDHYLKEEYDIKERFSSYWHQINEILSLNSKKILEVGIGGGMVSSYLKVRGKQITTLDIDKKLSPDVVGSVTEIPFSNESFDVVACYEVLEHLPFQYFLSALLELNRISRANVILSLPDKTGRAYRLNIQLPKLGEVKKLITLPRLKPIEWEFDGVHYWEVGTKGFALNRITSCMQKAGFSVRNNYRVFEYPYHRIFILEKGLPNKAN